METPSHGKKDENKLPNLTTQADLIIHSSDIFGEKRLVLFGNPNRLGGFFWALGSDPTPREEIECVRRFLHQRLQVSLLRKARFEG